MKCYYLITEKQTIFDEQDRIPAWWQYAQHHKASHKLVYTVKYNTSVPVTIWKKAQCLASV